MVASTTPLAREVLASFPLTVRHVSLENYKGKKGVWWVLAVEGRFVLKKLPPQEDRVGFILAAADYVRERGVRIPEVVPTRDGRRYVRTAEGCYVLSLAAPGGQPTYTVPTELAAVMRALAAFHRASRGFIPPEGVSPRSHLGRWETEYASRLQALRQRAEIAGESPSGEFTSIVRQETAFFIDLAQRALDSLPTSPYSAWVERFGRNPSLCHQDFAAGNLSLTSGGEVYVFDIDAVTIDLPARDIRKIVNKVMKKAGRWDGSILEKMLAAYQAVNPLTSREYEVVGIDMLFPHLYCGITDKYFRRRNAEWTEAKYLRKLKEMVDVEKSKVAVMASFPEIVTRLTTLKRERT